MKKRHAQAPPPSDNLFTSILIPTWVYDEKEEAEKREKEEDWRHPWDCTNWREPTNLFFCPFPNCSHLKSREGGSLPFNLNSERWKHVEEEHGLTMPQAYKSKESLGSNSYHRERRREIAVTWGWTEALPEGVMTAATGNPVWIPVTKLAGDQSLSY